MPQITGDSAVVKAAGTVGPRRLAEAMTSMSDFAWRHPPVATANGKVRGAPIKLKRVELGSISVEDVEGLVLPDSALSSNLLGMSFLSQVNWSQKGGNLVLEQ